MLSPAMRAMAQQFAPELVNSLDMAQVVTDAFSAALTPEQQVAMRDELAKGPEAFIYWSRRETGRTAIRAAVDKFLEGVK